MRTLGKSLCAAAAALAATTACGDSTPDLDPDSEELWLLQTRLFGDEETLGYVIPVTELSGHITNQRGLEQGGGGMVYAPPTGADGSFLLSYAERATLTRYQVTDRNELVEGVTLSFANHGVESGYGVVAWVDAHTAYWIDHAQLQAIRFDPTDMEVERAIPIEGTERPGFITEFSGYPVVRADGVYFTVRWRKDWDEAPQASPGAMLVHIDPATDRVTVTEDARCTSLLVSHTTPSGDTYFFSDNYNTYARILRGTDAGVPDCSLRLRAGERTFDPTWYLDLADRTGGRPADGVVAGAGSTVWLSVWHADRLAEPPADLDEVDVARAWQWYALDVERDAPAVESTQRPHASHGAFGWFTAARSFTSTVNDDYTESSLLEVTGLGFEERATVQGLLDAIVRVR